MDNRFCHLLAAFATRDSAKTRSFDLNARSLQRRVRCGKETTEKTKIRVNLIRSRAEKIGNEKIEEFLLLENCLLLYIS